MAVVVRAVIILRSEGTGALLRYLVVCGEGVLSEGLPLGATSGALTLSAAAELEARGQVFTELPQHMDPGTEVSFLWWWRCCLRVQTCACLSWDTHMGDYVCV